MKLAIVGTRNPGETYQEWEKLLLDKINPAVQACPDTPPESTFHVPVSYFNVFHNLSDDLKTNS